MSGDAEFGKCEVCGIEAILNRKIWRYDITCQCHSPHHFDMTRHCNNCVPTQPKETKITFLTSDLKLL